MIRIRTVLLIITIASLLIGISAAFFASMGSTVAQDTGTHQRAPLNPEFLDYLDNPPDPFYGYIPPPVSLSHLSEITMPRMAALTQLPGAFDWRDTGKVTPVKNQNPCGTCWIFGTIAAIESRVLIVDDVEYDFSEQNVACCTDPSWVYLDGDRCGAGGWSWLATDTLTKKGTRLESCDPYDTGTINTESCDDTCTTIKRVTGYRWVANSPDQIDEVKNAIYNYGPVSMAYYNNPAYMYPGSVYYYPDCSQSASHLVSIVGWDDGIAHPAGGGSGVWIVKNSWGIGWGDGGYFYLCYGSANMQEVASYRYQDYHPGERVYYWDEAGRVGATGWIGYDAAWMASVFTCEQDGDLTYVDFWTTSNNAQYELYVYDGSFGSELTSQTGTCDELGYYSIPLDTPMPMTAAQQFTVAVKMTTPGYNYPLPVEYEWLGWADPPIQSGVCFEKRLDSDPWQDAGVTWGENVCLRAKILTNAPPSVDSVAITPDPAYTNTDLTAVPSGWSDADGGPEGYQWQWQKWDGLDWQDISGATSDTLDGSNFVKDDQIKVICTPDDGHDTGSPVEDEITISNTPPTAPVVDVTPDFPLTTDNLICTVTAESTDVDGDTVTYTYEWYKDDVPQPDETTTATELTDTVSSTLTAKEDVWKCVVTPSDGTADGPTGEDQVTVVNSPPTAPEVDVTPDLPTIADDLTCTVITESTDVDGDTVTYTYEWYKDTVLQSGETTTTTDLSDTVSSTLTISGEVWKCVVTPSDGTVDGPTDEDQVRVDNTVPTAPEVDVTPDLPATAGDLTCTITTPSTDPDPDTVTYTYEWYKDDVPQPDETTTTTALTDTVPSALTAKEETWKCVVTPNDGFGNGPSDEDQVTLINSPPSVGSVVIIPDPAYTNTDLTAVPSGWDDADGDPEGYQWQWQKWSGSDWEDIAAATSDTLDSSNFVKYDQIKVICTPDDGHDTGSPVDDEITISNAPPTADAGPDQGKNVSTLVTLDGSGSSDPDGDPLTYAWTQTDGSAVTISDSTAVAPTFTPTVADAYTFSLVVNDGDLDSAPGTVLITVTRPAGGGGGGGGAPPEPKVKMDILDTLTSASMTEEGMLKEALEVTSGDGTVSLCFPEGTQMLDSEGNPLKEITVDPVSDLPEPPAKAHIIGVACDFEPDGAIFEPPIELIVTYDPEALPEGVNEEDLVIALYDAESGEWVLLPSRVDPDTHTITASISHFTVFGVIGREEAAFDFANLSISPNMVDSEENVTMTIDITNVGGLGGSCTIMLLIDGAEEATQKLTLAPGASDTVTFVVTREDSGTYSVEIDRLTGEFTVRAHPVPWALVGSIIGGVLGLLAVAAITVYLVFFRRRRAAA